MDEPRNGLVRIAGHGAGAVGVAVVVLLAVGLATPPAEQFPDELLPAFHTFFVGIFVELDGLPDRHDADFLIRAEPGDVLFVSRGQVPWGQWSHAAVVVRAPADSKWVEPGTLAVVEAGIQDAFWVAPLDAYAEWPRVALRRASADPRTRRRIADAALAARGRVFASVALGASPYANCTKVTTDALSAAGLEVDITGWRTPDELFGSSVWLD